MEFQEEVVKDQGERQKKERGEGKEEKERVEGEKEDQ